MSSAIVYSQQIASVPTRKRSPANAWTSSMAKPARKQPSAAPCERSWPMNAPAVMKPSAIATRNMTCPSSVEVRDSARAPVCA